MSVEHFKHSERTGVSWFKGDNGCDEYFILVRSKREPFFQSSLKNVLRDYRKVLERYNLSQDTQVFTRFILSDIQNQKVELVDSELFDFCKRGAVSIIGQPPAFYGGGIYFLSYHIAGGKFERNLLTEIDGEPYRNGIMLKGANYDLLYTGAFSGSGEFHSFSQTEKLFADYRRLLGNYEMDLLPNCLRTWLYVRDIDNHYAGLVEARNQLFDKCGLTPETRYIASTGIEGKSLEVKTLVSMDALAIKRMNEDQVVRMDAPDHMCPTNDYGVTFERGQTIRFGDREHHHISGTASIDTSGEVLHLNDVRKQTDRALENIEALLKRQGASLKDMAYFIVYLRNPRDIGKVKEVMLQQISHHVPMVFVEGAVCRPSWLVEIEGVAITDADNQYADFQ